MIVRNSAKCLICGDEIESRGRHDFRECKCENIFVDGGTAYLRGGVRHGPDTMQDTSVVTEEGPLQLRGTV